MSEKRIFILSHEQARQGAIEAVRNAPAGWKVTIDRKKRTVYQNSRYWGKCVLYQIAEQATANGRRFDSELWHEYFKKKFLGVRELPDGSVVGNSSAGLNTVEFSEFCEQVEAYAVTELGVVFVDEREVTA